MTKKNKDTDLELEISPKKLLDFIEILLIIEHPGKGKGFPL